MLHTRLIIALLKNESLSRDLTLKRLDIKRFTRNLALEILRQKLRKGVLTRLRNK